MPARLHIDPSQPTPVYQQIVDGLRRMLVAGEVRVGARLAPVRQLALDLGVHHNTVAEAYRVLAAEGWLELRRRRGAMVVARAEAERSSAATAQQWRLRLEEVCAKAIAGGLTRAELVRTLERIAKRMGEEGGEP